MQAFTKQNCLWLGAMILRNTCFSVQGTRLAFAAPGVLHILVFHVPAIAPPTKKFFYTHLQQQFMSVGDISKVIEVLLWLQFTTCKINQQRLNIFFLVVISLDGFMSIFITYTFLKSCIVRNCVCLLGEKAVVLNLRCGSK